MHARNHEYPVWIDAVEETVRKPTETNSAGIAMKDGVCGGLFLEALDRKADGSEELISWPLIVPAIPMMCILDVRGRSRAE